MGLSVGVGLTNACDLACAHCYRDTARVDQLSLTDVASVWDALPVRSMNLGTGENGLHPDYNAIVAAIAARGVKLSVTSNGLTLERSSDQTLRTFREVEVSIDFPTEAEQDAFRGPGNWKRVTAAIERARRLDVTVTVLSVMMKLNYRRLADIARLAFAVGATYRVNVYQPVRTDAFTLTYDEFWDGFSLCETCILTFGGRDGGYYLIGVRASYPRLFEGIPWSTPAVLPLTLSRVRELGLRVHFLPAWFDIDTEPDLRRLHEEMRTGGGPPRTLAFVRALYR